jgi:hypothetical protein
MLTSKHRFELSLLFAALTLFAARTGAIRRAVEVRALELKVLQQKSPRPKKPAKETPKDLPMPFRAGETLNYRVVWSMFSNAASVQLSVPERRTVLGWSTWHFRAVAHTLNPVRTIFAIDDQFDSYTDTASFESHQFEMYLDEMGRKQERTLHLVPQGQSPQAGFSSIVVLPGTRDPLGALYALRGVDWQRTLEYRVPVYDGHSLLEIRAKVDAADEPIALATGTFAATRVSIRVFQFNKQIESTSLIVWLAHDSARTPMAMQAEIPIGSFRVELTSPSK